MSTLSTTRVDVFDRITCAFDGSLGSIEAATQAEVLRDGLGEMELVGVYPTLTLYSVNAAPLIVTEAERTFDERFAAGCTAVPSATAGVFHGPAIQRLLQRVTEFHATLVATGATARSRPVGAVLGNVPTAMLHHAPCSVLVAKRPWAGPVPRSIVVGYDGSRESSDAVSVGRNLAARFDAILRIVLADEGASIWSEELDGLWVEEDARHPVEALREASKSAELLVVGSRGLQGLKAIGSVSERVGHVSSCSVLVVRDAPGR